MTRALFAAVFFTIDDPWPVSPLQVTMGAKQMITAIDFHYINTISITLNIEYHS